MAPMTTQNLVARRLCGAVGERPGKQALHGKE
jgi:hypothetical protein